MNDNRVEWSPGMSIDQIEKEVILAAFRHFRGNKTATARSLNISIRTLENKIAMYEEQGKTAEVKKDGRTAQYNSELNRARGFTTNERGAVQPITADGKVDDGRLKSLGSYAKTKEGLPKGAGTVSEPPTNVLPPATRDGTESTFDLPAQQPVSLPIGQEVQSVLPEQPAPVNQHRRRR